MRIRIEEHGEKKLSLCIPTGLLLNRLTASVLPGIISVEDGAALSAAQLHAIFRALNDFRRSHPDWPLVDVESADGKRVQIIL